MYRKSAGMMVSNPKSEATGHYGLLSWDCGGVKASSDGVAVSSGVVHM